MKRSVFVFFCLLPTVLLLTVSLIGAQQAGKAYRIGILRSGSSSSYLYAPQHKILRQGLRELGYTEGKNLLIDMQRAS